MSERTITFKVNTSDMFDMIAQTGGDFTAVGSRLASCLLGGPGWQERYGLAVYGIEIVSNELSPQGAPDER